MQALVVRLTDSAVVVIVRVSRIRAAAVVGASRHARGHVLVDRHQQLLALEVLIADARNQAPAQRVLEFEVGLLRIRVLQVLVHRLDRDERGRRQTVGQDVWKHRCSTLRRKDAGDLRLAFLGGRPGARPEGMGPLGARVNVLTGASAKQWQPGLPAYGGLRFRNVYPGIDARYEAHASRLKAEFVVAPGADPSAIRLAYGDAESVRIDDAGRPRRVYVCTRCLKAERVTKHA